MPACTTRRSSTRAAARSTPTTCAARCCASRSRPTAPTTSRPGTCSRPERTKTRPEVYAMGFRNPFRIQVDENDVAYVTDYSPDSAVPENFRGPAGTGRVEIVRKPSNYGWPLCVSPELPYYRWNFNTSKPLDADADPARVRQPDARAEERVALEHRPRVRRRRSAQPDLWYSYRDNADPAARHAVPGVLRRLRRHLPAAVPGALHGRRRAARRGQVPLRRRQPEPDEVPAVLRRRDLPRRVRPGHAARGPPRREQADLQDQQPARLRRLHAPTASTKPFECDSPMDMQFGPTARSTC